MDQLILIHSWDYTSKTSKMVNMEVDKDIAEIKSEQSTADEIRVAIQSWFSFMTW